jgi:type II secretory pathway pseudopilin PulG
VVTAIISLLAALCLSSFSQAKQKGNQIECMNNLKQLGLTLQLYALENEELYPPNPEDGNNIPGHNWCPGLAGAGDGAEFNSDLLQDAKTCLVSPYLSGNKNVWHCPSDLRNGKYQGDKSDLMNRTVSAARTYSMNQAVGTICPGYDQGSAHQGTPDLSVNGPWLNGRETHRRNQPFQTYGKTTSFTSLGPSTVWTVIEEDCQGQNVAAF